MAQAKTRKGKRSTKLRSPYPTKPTAEDRKRQFKVPPAEMPEGLGETSKVAAPTSGAKPEADADEKSWSDVVAGPTPDQWGVLADGTKTAGGPIKYALCPGCIHLSKDGTCSSSMNEDMRNNPKTISCMNAKRLDGKEVM